MFTFCGRYTGSADPDSTLLTNIQNMAGVLTENLLNGCLKGIQHIEGNERLNGTGKAAAVNTESALALQVGFAQSKRYRNFLMLDGTCGSDVLQIHPGAATGFLDQIQERFDIIPAKGFHQLSYPVVSR